MVYGSDFDSLTTGYTLPSPGAPGQDGWYLQFAAPPAYGEIQNLIANPGNALHEFTGIANQYGQPTIDQRDLIPPDLNANPTMFLEADFYASTSDLLAFNPYGSSLAANGQGFQIIAFVLAGGNGTAKGDTGVSVLVYSFNGVNDNGPIPLTVGQHLAWNQWHHVELIADHNAGFYVSVTVDGQAQDISGYYLTRQDLGGGEWVVGEHMETLVASIAPNDLFGGDTDDEIYWDNIRLEVGLFYDSFETGDLDRWAPESPQ